MNKTSKMAIAAIVLPLSLSGCLSSGGGGMAAAQNSVLVSEVVSVCGAIVGDQAEQRINQEWAKYPEADANRPVIETMAEVLLTNPEATEQQRTSQYRKYLTCATGLLMAKGVLK